jgi:hypothetical protein
MPVLSPELNPTATKLYDAVKLEHDPEKCAAVFRKNHAQSNGQSAMTIQADLIAPWRVLINALHLLRDTDRKNICLV